MEFVFKWKDSFCINIEEIDKQHKKLFEIGARVYDVLSLDDGYDHYDQIIEIINELKDYTVYHFNYEEELMKKYGYEGLEEQHFQHVFFIKKLERIANKDIDVHQKDSTVEIMEFLADWISSHILKSDIKYKDFFVEKGVF